RFLLPEEAVRGGGILDRHFLLRWGNFRLSKSLLAVEYDVSLHQTPIHEEIDDNAWVAACILIKFKKS
ncbi:MAG: hypothetical protein WAN11_13635, partial [Syntrophobacteraceae bacterium]